MESYDVVVVGSGPNGLAAAITMARAGFSVAVYEASDKAGGGLRSAELTLPGFVHDVFSAVHPMAITSKFISELPLNNFGLEWVFSPAQTAHPFDDGTSVTLEKSVEETAESLGRDKKHYIGLMRPLVNQWQNLFSETFQPLLHVPKHPLLLAEFGLNSILSANAFAHLSFKEERARALFMGTAAHANCSLDTPGTASIGLMLMLAGHAKGWPFPKGGAGQLACALENYFKSLGGQIFLGQRITNVNQLPKSKCVFFDLTTTQLAELLKDKLPDSYRRRIMKLQPGPGVFKMDWALSGPIPWTAKKCLTAATIHVGGSSAEVRISESLPVQGKVSDRPYVLVTQPSVFDATRAPRGMHTAWGYCHVPNGSLSDRTIVIENQIERFAPGFKDLILGRHTLYPKDLERRNANLVGGDISGGEINLGQLLFRPIVKLDPYAIPIPGYFLCSSSTAPGPGVHGMSGYNSAKSAIKYLKAKKG